ncbi:helix-turn-helix domain-containing protein [Desulfolucanica intricata]|uniref:helix-turn-helix domain-containing protein n=1 Tax=Desulfolucanica intricata TaxID=1285191 RepID=UPI00082A90A5|nr:helix-turn-helix domain-containing protein [Desulfolucanica intricata]
MVKKRFNILMENTYDEEDTILRTFYEAWREYNKGKSEPFFPVFNTFMEKHLKELEAGPLRLFLFFGFRANNQYGHSWYSIEKIAEYFNTQPRTINNWIKKLVDEGLIYRDRKGKKSNTTYLIPYSTTLIRLQPPKVYQEASELVDALIEIVKKYQHIYGSIIGVYHLFQWKMKVKAKRKVPNRNGNTQWVLILSQRDNGPVTALYYPLQHFDDYGVSKLYIDDHQLFNSPLRYENKQILGLALNHEFQIDGPAKWEAISELVEDLRHVDTEFFEQRAREFLEYGKIEKVLEEVDEENGDADNEENEQRS